MAEMSFGRKYGLIFGGIILIAGVVLATAVFPFWNLIRDDIYEDVVIMSSNDGICVADTSDNIPKHIEDCTAAAGDTVTIRYGEGLAWAKVADP